MPETTPTYTTQPVVAISGPLINVQGSVDKPTADYVISQVTEKLKSVIVEASSSSAPATSKRIRTSLSAI
jgi:predicted RNase H-like nuclease (RuvC/YqgF family)